MQDWGFRVQESERGGCCLAEDLQFAVRSFGLPMSYRDLSPAPRANRLALVRNPAQGGHKGSPYDRTQPPLTAGTIEISAPEEIGVASPPV